MKTKENSGITLIALVVTIVVLLILAGISIATLTGENGIITQAQKAKEETERAEKEEEEDLQESNDKINEYISSDKKNVIYFKIYDIRDENNWFDCKAEQGMTWEKWANSEYNDIGAYLNKPIVGIDSVCIKDFAENDDGLRPGTINTWIEGSGYSMVKGQDVINTNNTYLALPDLGECVFPDTEILVSSQGDTVLAKDLEEGSNIAYYNFETGKTEIGKVLKKYIHPKATGFVRFTFDDGSYLEATDYHPIYTEQGWKSFTRRNGHEIPIIGDKVKTENGWKVLTNIENWEGLEDCYDFSILKEDGTTVNNYYANGTLVQGSY